MSGGIGIGRAGRESERGRGRNFLVGINRYHRRLATTYASPLPPAQVRGRERGVRIPPPPPHPYLRRFKQDLAAIR